MFGPERNPAPAGRARGAMTAARRDPRHRAREAALQILYHWDIARTDVREAADTFFDAQWSEGPGGRDPAPDAVRRFATGLASETVADIEAIDRLIAETTERWRPERMAVIDRLILRMAVGELLHAKETPPAVIINEALELARTFSTEDAVKFINGLLDGIRKKLDAH
jgi:N utilization substance protein B